MSVSLSLIIPVSLSITAGHLLTDKNTTDIFHKDTHTQYNSYSQSSKNCSSNLLLKNQIELTEQSMMWKDFSKYIRKSLLKNIYEDIPQKERININKDNIPTN